ncbi:MAG: hypothetical protein JJE13_07765 [Thermoleophilia bacterium]|nr:hypothetical protein [Thermoleophilia bacterium]
MIEELPITGEAGAESPIGLGMIRLTTDKSVDFVERGYNRVGGTFKVVPGVLDPALRLLGGPKVGTSLWPLPVSDRSQIGRLSQQNTCAIVENTTDTIVTTIEKKAED